MTDSNQQSGRLTQRDQRIMQHISRYRITTNEVLSRTVLEESSPNAIVKVTRRLCRLGYLRKFPLMHPQCYFTPGDRAVRELGIPSHRTQPLGPQSLPTEFAVLAFALLGKSEHRRLTVAEMRERYSWMSDALAESAHCLSTESGREILESIRVDLGAAADHIARKCDADLQVRVAIKEFYPLIARKRFRAVVLTATTEKAAAIERSLSDHVWPKGYAFHLAVVPELLHLIPGGHHAR